MHTISWFIMVISLISIISVDSAKWSRFLCCCPCSTKSDVITSASHNFSDIHKRTKSISTASLSTYFQNKSKSLNDTKVVLPNTVGLTDASVPKISRNSTGIKEFGSHFATPLNWRDLNPPSPESSVPGSSVQARYEPSCSSTRRTSLVTPPREDPKGDVIRVLCRLNWTDSVPASGSSSRPPLIKAVSFNSLSSISTPHVVDLAMRHPKSHYSWNTMSIETDPCSEDPPPLLGDRPFARGSNQDRVSEIVFSSTNSDRSPTNQQFYAIKHLSAEYRPSAELLCPQIIDMIPIDINNFKEHPFWRYNNISSELLYEWLLEQCCIRWDDLYSLRISDIQDMIRETRLKWGHSRGTSRSSLSSMVSAKSSLADELKQRSGSETLQKEHNNLVVLNFEKTVLSSSNMTPFRASSNASLSNYNVHDLTFGHIEMRNLRGSNGTVIVYRRGLMDLLRITLPDEIGKNTFDFVVYSDATSHSTFFNAVAIEMYFNFYWMILKNQITANTALTDYLESRHFFEFKFVMTCNPKRDGKRIRKSLHALNRVIGPVIDQYDRILIIDSRLNLWDQRHPPTPLMIWHRVLGVNAGPFQLSFDPNTNSSDWSGQRQKDKFLLLLWRFLGGIERHFHDILVKDSSFEIHWIRLQKQGIAFLKRTSS